MPSFENVREQLLLAGIAPRHARRYVTELREHLADLVAQERATGLEVAPAEERARSLLGSDAQLAEAMIRTSRRSTRSETSPAGIDSTTNGRARRAPNRPTTTGSPVAR